MLVGVSGFGSTGSGAVMDYLREFDEVGAGRSMELAFLYDPDGVLDMEYHLILNPIRFYSGDAAIKRFKRIIYSYDLVRYVNRFMSVQKFKEISNDYIEDLIQMQWEGGLWHFDRRQVSKFDYWIKYLLGGKILRIFDKLHLEQPKNFLNHRMYIPVHDDRFYIATRKYTTRLLKEMCDTSKKIIAIDQPFPSNNPACCFKFFEQECKAIIVKRDPRDLYLISKKLSFGWERRFTPTHNVEEFIEYYKDQMDLIKEYGENVLCVQFEDLIYNYEVETQRIKKFLGLSGIQHAKKYFDPAVSIANTQMILRYPELKSDIEKIEKSLSKYLYLFDESKADLNARMWAFKNE
ncbi:hypothetical protein [Phocaeicola dorei]|uniref:hypothetical protein n=1 Tax=Phocaeicola dorei TaxID=357276 RepID=UPI00321A097C